MDIQIINPNIICSVGFSILAAVVGTQPTVIGIRDYIFILIGAALSTAWLIEHWFLDKSILTCCLIGYYVGFLAKDVYLNLKATIPDFIKDILVDILTWIKDRIRKFFNM